MKKNIIITLFIIAVTLTSFFFYEKVGFAPSLFSTNQTNTTNPDLAPNTTLTLSQKGIVNAVVFDNLSNGKIISSPFTILGQARGWYYEGTFPIELKNEKGVSLYKGSAEAEGDWISGKYVPFSIQINFNKQPSGSKGTLIFSKSNASGLPSNDDSVIIPVVFK